jgi:hypothetical protein
LTVGWEKSEGVVHGPRQDPPVQRSAGTHAVLLFNLGLWFDSWRSGQWRLCGFGGLTTLGWFLALKFGHPHAGRLLKGAVCFTEELVQVEGDVAVDALALDFLGREHLPDRRAHDAIWACCAA